MTEQRAGVCPDCPASRNRVLQQLVGGGRGRCAFRCLLVATRHALPPRWFGSYGLALVRRGILVRQRVDVHGSATAVDVLGPGAAMPLSEGGETSSAGYAADDALVCLCPVRALRAAVDAGWPTSSEVVTLQATALDRVERIAGARSRPTALSRVAALLGVLADTLSPPRRLTTIPAALQQRDMAALLAMRHESVCRALGILECRGALARGEDGIRLLHRARLETA
jgi:CRP-like cAMP-binding protein